MTTRRGFLGALLAAPAAGVAVASAAKATPAPTPLVFNREMVEMQRKVAEYRAITEAHMRDVELVRLTLPAGVKITGTRMETDFDRGVIRLGVDYVVE